MEEKLSNMKIRFNYVNVYGEEFTTERIVPEDFIGMSEIEILNDTYKNFLQNLTYPVYDFQKVAIINEDE